MDQDDLFYEYDKWALYEEKLPSGDAWLFAKAGFLDFEELLDLYKNDPEGYAEVVANAHSAIMDSED